MEGEQDPSVQIQHNAMHETIDKAMAATSANHNEVLLNGTPSVHLSQSFKQKFFFQLSPSS